MTSDLIKKSFRQKDIGFISSTGRFTKFGFYSPPTDSGNQPGFHTGIQTVDSHLISNSIKNEPLTHRASDPHDRIMYQQTVSSTELNKKKNLFKPSDLHTVPLESILSIVNASHDDSMRQTLKQMNLQTSTHKDTDQQKSQIIMNYAKLIMQDFATKHISNARDLKDKVIRDRLEAMKANPVHRKGESIDAKIKQAKERRDMPACRLRGKWDRKREPVIVDKQSPMTSMHLTTAKPKIYSRHRTPGPGEYHQSSSWITPTHNLKYYNPV